MVIIQLVLTGIISITITFKVQVIEMFSYNIMVIHITLQLLKIVTLQT